MVTRTPEKFQISSYIYSWIISNKTLVEELIKSIPTPLPCQFEFTKFLDLYKYADSESPQSRFSLSLPKKAMYYSFKQATNLFLIQNTDVRGIVLQCFPSEEQGSPLITKRDVVIVNEE